MMKRRICAIVLSIMTAISMTPMMAFADDVAAPMEGNASATMEDVSETYVYPRCEQITLMQNEVIDLSSFVVFGNQVPANAISITVGDEAIAFYSNNKLAGMSEGATMMTVSYGDTSFSVPVVVVAETSEPTSIGLDQTALGMAVGDQTHLKLSMTPENAAMGDITWSSSDSGVVTVDEGVLRAVGKGTAEITASYGELSAVCTVTVNKVPIKAILTDDRITVPIGQQYTITYTENPLENDETEPMTFVSADPSIATVSDEGVVTGVDTGTTTITLTKGDVSKDVAVTVTRPLQGISIESDTNQIYKNETCQLKVIYDPTDTTDSKIVNWYCDAPDVARVDENGKVTALKKGIVEITAQVGQFHASCSIICLERPITEFTLNKTELSLKQGETTKLQATYYPDNTTDDTNILWQSSDENVVAVDEEGKVFAVGSGEADITATVNGHNATCKAVVDSEWIWPDVVHSGSCGQTVWWALDSQGVLYIYGFGNMVSKKHEWAGEPTPPWNYGSTSYISSIRRAIIFEGVTNISQNAFSGCGKLVSVFIPSTVTRIEKHAFWSCGLRDVTIPDSVVIIDSWAFNSLKVVRYYGTKEEWDKISIGRGNDTFNTALFRYNCIKAPLSFALADAEYEYDGNAKTPTLNITDSYGNMLVEGEDYELIYQNNVNAGQACILVKGKGIYQGEESIPFNIDSALINKCTIRDIPSVVYNGTSQTPACEVEFQGSELVEGLDYRVVYLNNTDAGTATVKVSGINNFNGTVTKTFVIEPKEISPIIDLSSSEYIYNGLALRPKVIVKDGELVLGDDSYEVHMPADSTTAGTKLVSVSLKGNYKGEAVTTYIIRRADISQGAEILVEDAEYCGEPVTGNVRVIYNNRTLEEGLDYSIEYNNNIEAGTATVVICGMANYTGTVAKNFEIKPKAITPTITMSSSKLAYNGKNRSPSVYVYDGDKKLTKYNAATGEGDYRITMADSHKNAGEYSILVTMCGNYAGSGETSFEITPKAITPTIKVSSTELTYNGKDRSPSVYVYDGSTKLTKYNAATGEGDYKISMAKSHKNVGKWTITVTLCGNYAGSAKTTFNIIPKGTSLKKVTSTKAKTFTVTWNKQTEKMSTKQITGYQIQWSTSSTFAKDNHTKKVAGVNSASKTITSKDWSGIKGGKTYYLRIRTYTTTSSGTYYSSWSTKSLKVTTKK